MRLRLILLIATISFLFIGSMGFAQTKVGTAGAQFLKLGVSARAVALGDGFVALVDDASAMFYNPAGISLVGKGQIMLHDTELPADLRHNYIGLILPQNILEGKIGLSFIMLTSNDMEETTPDMPDGTGRFFTISEYAGALSYCIDLTDKFSAAGTFKYIVSNLGDFPWDSDVGLAQASTWAVDIGTLYRTGFRSLNFGMAITNFGPDLEYITNATPLPINFKVGISFDIYKANMHSIKGLIEGSHPNDNAERMNFGTEYNFKDLLFLRGGYKFNYDDESVTGGLGLHLRGGSLQFNYAYEDFDVLPGRHRFTMAIGF